MTDDYTTNSRYVIYTFLFKAALRSKSCQSEIRSLLLQTKDWYTISRNSLLSRARHPRYIELKTLKMHVRHVGREFKVRASGFTLGRHLTKTTQLLTHFPVKCLRARATFRRVFRQNLHFFRSTIRWVMWRTWTRALEGALQCSTTALRVAADGAHRASSSEQGTRKLWIHEEIQSTSWWNLIFYSKYSKLDTNRSFRTERRLSLKCCG